MLTFYHSPQTRSGRTMWLLEEFGAPYETRYVGIQRRDGSGGRDPANIHPDGKVPALVHDGVLVTEGLAIALYLTDLFPDAPVGVAARDPARATFLTWLAWNTGEFEPTVFARMSSAPGEDHPHARQAYRDVVGRIETALAAGPYLLGERFTAADVMIGSVIEWARAALPPSAAMDAYVARLAARPANRAAKASDEAPTSTTTA